jgi:hypothetical protein
MCTYSVPNECDFVANKSLERLKLVDRPFAGGLELLEHDHHVGPPPGVAVQEVLLRYRLHPGPGYFHRPHWYGIVGHKCDDIDLQDMSSDGPQK